MLYWQASSPAHVLKVGQNRSFWPFFGGVVQHITRIFWKPASVCTRHRDVRCPSACISPRHGKVWYISDFACRSFVRSFRLCPSPSRDRAAIPFDTGQSDSLVVVEVSFLRLSQSILLSLFYYEKKCAFLMLNYFLMITVTCDLPTH